MSCANLTFKFNGCYFKYPVLTDRNYRSIGFKPVTTLYYVSLAGKKVIKQVKNVRNHVNSALPADLSRTDNEKIAWNTLLGNQS